MIFAGVSSLQNMFEAVGESLTHRFPKLNRKLVLVLMCVVCLGVGINMEAIFQWGPWMDFVSIYVIPLGAMLGALSWFWVMKKETFLGEINKGSTSHRGNGWYYTGRYLYVPITMILCAVALCMKIAF